MMKMQRNHFWLLHDISATWLWFQYFSVIIFHTLGPYLTEWTLNVREITLAILQNIFWYILTNYSNQVFYWKIKAKIMFNINVHIKKTCLIWIYDNIMQNATIFSTIAYWNFVRPDIYQKITVLLPIPLHPAFELLYHTLETDINSFALLCSRNMNNKSTLDWWFIYLLYHNYRFILIWFTCLILFCTINKRKKIHFKMSVLLI